MKISLLSDGEWDQQLQDAYYSSFFQTSFWKNAVCDFVGGKSAFFKVENNGKAWLVPTFTGDPWSKGYRIGSIGYGGPIPLQDSIDPFEEKSNILEIVQELSKHKNLSCTGVTTFPYERWNSLNSCEGQKISSTQVIPLSGSVKTMFDEVLTGNVRTAIRRSEQLSVECRMINGSDGIHQAHHLLSETQKHVNAAYITPFSFFSHLCSHEEKGVSLWGAYHQEELVAMSVLLHHGVEAFHFLHGWKRDEALPGVNQALIWEMIKHSMNLGYKTFNMGESHLDSLREAKRRWGAQEVAILRLTL